MIFAITLGAGAIAKLLIRGTPLSYALAVLAAFGAVSFAWTTFRKARSRKAQYEARLLELQDATYHVVSLDSADEAAALVAALGRQLHSPRRDVPGFQEYSEGRLAEELEIAATLNKAGATLYLSGAAMDAFTAAFAPPPGVRQVPGRDLPPDRIPVLIGRPLKPIGRDDVIKLLTP